MHSLDSQRRYQTMAYQFRAEPPFDILTVSRPLPLAGVGAANFASGLFVPAGTNKIIVSYGAHDAESRVLVMSKAYLEQLFDACAPPSSSSQLPSFDLPSFSTITASLLSWKAATGVIVALFLSTLALLAKLSHRTQNRHQVATTITTTPEGDKCALKPSSTLNQVINDFTANENAAASSDAHLAISHVPQSATLQGPQGVGPKDLPEALVLNSLAEQSVASCFGLVSDEVIARRPNEQRMSRLTIGGMLSSRRNGESKMNGVRRSQPASVSERGKLPLGEEKDASPLCNPMSDCATVCSDVHTAQVPKSSRSNQSSSRLQRRSAPDMPPSQSSRLSWHGGQLLRRSSEQTPSEQIDEGLPTHMAVASPGIVQSNKAHHKSQALALRPSLSARADCSSRRVQSPVIV